MRREIAPGLAVAADVFAKLLVDFGGLLDAVVEHGAPLFGVVVKGHGAEQEAGLEDDFEGVAEIVGEPANLLSLLLGDRIWAARVGSWKRAFLLQNVVRGQRAGLTWVDAFVTLGVAAVQRDLRRTLRAEVAELADAHGSGPCTRKGVGVRVPSSAPILIFTPNLSTYSHPELRS